MAYILIALIEAAALASSLSADAFAAGFAYGGKKIKLPMKSAHIINIICAAVTGLSLFFGALLRPFLPERLAAAIAFLVLLCIGLSKLLDSIVKTLIRKRARLDKKIKFSLFSVKFILNIYADPEEADADISGSISTGEAAALAIALSIDGIAVGFGAALADVNAAAVLLFSLITNLAAILLGHRLGERVAGKLKFNISYISGIVLIILAVLKLF